MNMNYLTGERIYLREVRLSDVNDSYYRWMNDRAVTQFLESRFYPHSMDGIRKYVEEKSNSRDGVFFAMVLREGDRHIGNIKIEPINWIHRFCELGLMLGERDCWGKGYGSEAISLVTHYAFCILNLHKVNAGCYIGNSGSIKAFEKSGFVREGLLKDHFFCDGKYQDYVIMGKVADSIAK